MSTAGNSLRAFIIAASGLLLVACASEPHHHRWNPNGTPRNEDWHSPTHMIMKFAGPDGVLTKAQLLAGLHKEFDSYDTGHTGCLTSDQVTAINEARTSRDESAASPLIDWQGKGCVDFDEYSATAISLFDQLDTNGDGKVTPEELHPKRRVPNVTPPPDVSNVGGGGP